MKEIELYTDGACSGNPGRGGWGCVLLYKSARKELDGFEAETTNNRMELTAALRGLSELKEPCRVNLYSDSGYMVDAFNLGRLRKWAANGWRTADGKEVKNRDLWEALNAAAAAHNVRFIKVEGHSGNPENERCDVLAKGAIKSARVSDGFKPAVGTASPPRSPKPAVRNT